MRHFLLITTLISLCFIAHAQPRLANPNKNGGTDPNRNIDSLKKLLLIVKEDSNKVNIQNELAKNWLRLKEFDSASVYSEEALDLAKKIEFQRGIVAAYYNMAAIEEHTGNHHGAIEDYKEVLKIMRAHENKAGMALAYHNLGSANLNQLNYSDALKSYFAALKLRQEVLADILENNSSPDEKLIKAKKTEIASTYNNIGIIYIDIGNQSEALVNYLASLKIAEEIDSKFGIALLSNNIGIIYKEQNNLTEALKYYNKGRKIKESIGQTNDMHYSNMISNIGNILMDQDKTEEARKNFLIALKIREELGDKTGIGNSHHSLGNVLLHEHKYNQSLEKFFEAMKIRIEIEDKVGLVASYIDIGNNYSKLNKNTEAFEFVNKGLKMAREIRHKEWTKNAYLNLSKLDSVEAGALAKSGKWKEASEYLSKAFSNYIMYTVYKDSLLNEENTKNVIKVQMDYEFDKIEETTQKDQALIKMELEQKKLQRNFLIVGIILIVLIGIFGFKNYNQKQKLKQIIAEQKRIDDVRIDTTRSI